MRRTSIVILFIVGVLALGLGGIYWMGTPRLVDISPADGASAILASSELHLTFSRPMQSDSVVERLVIEPSVPGVFDWQGNTLVYVPDQPWPSGETVKIKLKAGARASGILPLVMREARSWSFSINQPRLAYLYPDIGPADIYVLDPRTGANQRFTQSAGGIQDFQINANGTAIYYSERQQGSSGIYRLDLTVDAGSSESVLVLDCPRASCRGAVVSPDGAYLAYERTAFVGGSDPNYAQVWLLPLGANGLALAGAEPFLVGDSNTQMLMPDWSANNILSFYDLSNAQFVFQTPQGDVLTHFSNQTGEPGDWHPDASEFVAPEINFIDDGLSQELNESQAQANSHLLLFNIQDDSVLNLSRFQDLEDTAPVFSPDGAYLVFARKFLSINLWTPGRQIWLMRPGAWEAKPLTEEPLYSHFDFAWSPASDLLAYVRFNESALNEPTELWVMDPLTTRATLLLTGGYAPQWIP